MAHVIVVRRERGAEVVFAVQALRTGRVLHACVGVGERGAALGLLEAVAFCARRGHTIVTPEGAYIEAEEVRPCAA